MNIFVSYSSKDRERVRNLVQDLEEIGHEVWFDQELSGGQLWWDRIMANLRNCDLVIFALSPNWLNSYASGLEFDYATELGKNRLPVTVDTVDYPLLPTRIQSLQIVDYRNPDRASVTKLARALTHMPAPAPLPDPLPETPPAPISEWADIAQRLTDITLALDEQRAILKKIEGMLAEQSQIDRATSLLYRLRSHPDASTDIVQDVDSLLARYGIEVEGPLAVQPRPKRPAALLILLLTVALAGLAVAGVLYFRAQVAQADTPTPAATAILAEASATQTPTIAPVATPAALPAPTEAPATQNPIAYLTGSYQQVRLALFDPDADEPQIVGPETALGYSPAWAPDASRLATTIWRNNGSTVNAEGMRSLGLLSLAERVLHELAAPDADSDWPVSWSPDSSRFAFWCGGSQLCIASVSDGSVQTIDVIDQDYTHPGLAWSPDGSQIAYVCENDNENADICLLAIAEGGVQVLVLGINDDISPLWTSDGVALIYASSWDSLRPASTGAGAGIYRLDLTTSEVQRLFAAESERQLYDLTFSYDEAWISFTSGLNSRPELWVMAADGSGARLLEDRFTEEPRALWSPGANTLLYELRIDGYDEVFSISAAGGRPVNLTNNPATDESPTWSPDGSRIVFVSNRGGNRDLYLIYADGSGLTQLTNSPEDEFDPIWAP